MSPQAPTPVVAVRASLWAALTGDSAIQAILGAPRVYSGRAPRDAPLPFIVIADTTTADLATFDGKTGQGSNRLNVWGIDEDEALRLYSAVHDALHRVKLPLGTGFVMLSGIVRLTTSFADPSATAGHQAVASYEWTAQVVT